MAGCISRSRICGLILLEYCRIAEFIVLLVHACSFSAVSRGSVLCCRLLFLPSLLCLVVNFMSHLCARARVLLFFHLVCLLLGHVFVRLIARTIKCELEIGAGTSTGLEREIWSGTLSKKESPQQCRTMRFQLQRKDRWGSRTLRSALLILEH